jgi:hypothetical protein
MFQSLIWSIQQLELARREEEEERDLLIELVDILLGRANWFRFPAQRKPDV